MLNKKEIRNDQKAKIKTKQKLINNKKKNNKLP